MVQPCSLHSHLWARGQLFRWWGLLIKGKQLKGLTEEEASTRGAFEIYDKQEEHGSAPTLVLGHAEPLCHLKRHHSISKQLKHFA